MRRIIVFVQEFSAAYASLPRRDLMLPELVPRLVPCIPRGALGNSPLCQGVPDNAVGRVLGIIPDVLSNGLT